MSIKPRVKSKRVLARTRIFRVDELELQFPNGRVVRFETLSGEHPASVLIVPFRDACTVLLVREYGAAHDRYELGFPKGLVEADEDLLAAANREIMEEIGYAAQELRYLRSLSLAPGYIRHETHVILAYDLFAARRPGDEPEELQTVSWSLHDTAALLARDDFTEARSIAALLLVRDLMEQ